MIDIKKPLYKAIKIFLVALLHIIGVVLFSTIVFLITLLVTYLVTKVTGQQVTVENIGNIALVSFGLSTIALVLAYALSYKRRVDKQSGIISKTMEDFNKPLF